MDALAFLLQAFLVLCGISLVGYLGTWVARVLGITIGDEEDDE